MNIWLALLVGAALAPTDAALGAGVMLNRAVPARISRLINVESGLNDGIAIPFVFVALAGAGTAAHEPGIGPGAAVAELALGLAVGVAVGGAGGWLVRLARRRGGAAWRAARTVRRGDRGPGVAAGLARVRRGRHHPGARGPDMAARGVCGAQPDP
jgi:NhaP-type Na+/H+ or K+/H+ antiporter